MKSHNKCNRTLIISLEYIHVCMCMCAHICIKFNSQKNLLSPQRISFFVVSLHPSSLAYSYILTSTRLRAAFGAKLQTSATYLQHCTVVCILCQKPWDTFSKFQRLVQSPYAGNCKCRNKFNDMPFLPEDA